MLNVISLIGKKPKIVFKINWLKTIYINMKMFPFRIAIKFPIIIYARKCRLDIKGGEIILDAPIRRGMLRIGYLYEIFSYKEPLQLTIHGRFVVKGEVWLGSSVAVYVGENATLTMGNLSSLGSCGVLICTHKVTFSDYSRIGSGSYVSDSNYHYMKNIDDGSIYPYVREVYIGEQNYIGSKVSLLPGTKTPANITIGYGSVCNKDYRKDVPENSVLAGMPAKLVKTGIVRIFDFEKERQISQYFKETKALIFYDK